jgi:hypothetical protein
MQQADATIMDVTKLKSMSHSTRKRTELTTIAAAMRRPGPRAGAVCGTGSLDAFMVGSSGEEMRHFPLAGRPADRQWPS